MTHASQEGFLVVIVGATGTGKSRLGIQLAEHLNGEVINADALQVYSGLAVTTNQVPPTERKGIPHHLLGCISPSEEFTVKHFRDAAIPIVEDVLQRGKVPIVVGGSNYYIQSLLSKNLLDDWVDEATKTLDESARDSPGMHLSAGMLLEGELKSFSHEEERGEEADDMEEDKGGVEAEVAMYRQLQVVDPVGAARLHPNDTRRVKRYLEIFRSTGISASRLFTQKTETQSSGTEWRWPCCLLWTQVQPSTLSKSIDARAQAMLRDGLLAEVAPFLSRRCDVTRGLPQAIGVREFAPYFADPHRPCASGTQDLQDARLRECVSSLQRNTKRLAKRQVRRLQTLRDVFGWNLHELDATSVLEALGDIEFEARLWQENVLNPALRAVKDQASWNHSIPAGSPAGGTSEIDANRVGSRLKLWEQRTCEVCDKVLRGSHEWTAHMKGNRHKKRAANRRKKHRLGSAISRDLPPVSSPAAIE
eukprot:CAMPEP_0114282782 /NCGR_PEP_ID=MMETSP0059-20121206/3742_1 /TAXON_ID=36894 /ORGANISM="Pyramimonas parkeae, Strain CCMP726" /LENGTH=476 /DNA_ID=CAMNT_0001403447 /DNA_START=65 /DNA_END=1495 /DNA_ORIENTATION=+